MSVLLGELWPSHDVTDTAQAWQKSCSVSLTHFFSRCFFLMYIQANTHCHTPSQNYLLSHIYTYTSTHYLHLTPEASCCGYLHHKQLVDTGGPLTGKWACLRKRCIIYSITQRSVKVPFQEQLLSVAWGSFFFLSFICKVVGNSSFKLFDFFSDFYIIDTVSLFSCCWCCCCCMVSFIWRGSKVQFTKEWDVLLVRHHLSKDETQNPSVQHAVVYVAMKSKHEFKISLQLQNWRLVSTMSCRPELQAARTSRACRWCRLGSVSKWLALI